MGGYGGGAESVFVRADVTYLRQDFSLLQPVGQPPAVQRYDYVVRVRALTARELPPLLLLSAQRTRDYRATVRYALRGLSSGGSGPGP